MAENMVFGTGKIVDYTGPINNIPLAPNLITSMGLFEGESVTTSTVILDIEDSTIGVYGTHARRSPAKRLKHDVAKQIPLIIPHIEVEDYIYPEDVEGRRAPGTQDFDRVSNVREKRLSKISRNFDLTHEYFRLSAIKGETKDGNGKTLFNSYDALGLTQASYQKEIDLSQTTGVASQLVEFKREIEQANQTGGIVSNFVCLCSPKFFDKLTENPDIKEAYGNQVGIANPNREDLRNGFYFKGISFREYAGSVKLENGTTVELIENGEAYLFPTDVPGMFQEKYAPKTDLNYVNTPGLIKYASEYSDPEARWLKITAETNTLMINTRPELVLRLITQA